MRAAVCVAIGIHGAIHVLGFLKAFGLAKLPELRALVPAGWHTAAPRLIGVLWLAACLVWIASAVAFAIRASGWWQLAAAGLLLSQCLIVLAWSGARAGTLVNLVLLVPIVFAAASERFERESQRATDAVLSRGAAAAAPSVVTAAELARLPAPVARWLEQSGVVGKPRATSVHLSQSGFLRTSPDGAWMPAHAEQDFAVDTPGFVWRVNVRMLKVLPVLGRDAYSGGEGRMLITLGGLLRVVDASGDKTDQGTLLRFLGEMVWFPSAALEDYMRWEAIDERSARATMTYAGRSDSAVFEVDDAGRIVNVSAMRYLGGGEDARLESWVIPIEAWDTLDGVRIPVRGVVRWQLAAGDFDYYRWRVLDVKYNPGMARNETTNPSASAFQTRLTAGTD